MTTAIVSRNPLVSHCAVPTVIRRSAISAGRATLMIVSLRIMTNAEPTNKPIARFAFTGAPVSARLVTWPLIRASPVVREASGGAGRPSG
jgi:hypothetical protein